MTEVLELSTELPGVVAREFATSEDDTEYWDLLEKSHDHLVPFEPETAYKYHSAREVEQARLYPEPPDKTRFGIRDTGIEEGSTLVGSANITPMGDDGARIGYLVHVDHTGHGYAKAAAKVVAELASKTHDRVFAEVVEGNIASAAVLESVGFRQTRREEAAHEVALLVFDYGCRDIVELLAPGETLTFDPPPRGSQQWAHGYNYAAIENNTHTEGDSVVLTVEPGGSVEPVVITGNITLSVTSLKGTGWLVKYNAEKADGVVEVIPVEQGGEAVTLKRGDAYYYLNLEQEELVLRDDCTPDFKETDETQIGVVSAAGSLLPLPVEFYGYFGRLQKS